MDLSTAYRYNQNMMEYYTCKLFLVVVFVLKGKELKCWRWSEIFLVGMKIGWLKFITKNFFGRIKSRSLKLEHLSLIIKLFWLRYWYLNQSYRNFKIDIMIKIFFGHYSDEKFCIDCRKFFEWNFILELKNKSCKL